MAETKTQSGAYQNPLRTIKKNYLGIIVTVLLIFGVIVAGLWAMLMFKPIPVLPDFSFFQ